MLRSSLHRFGVALIDGKSPGTMRVKGNEFSLDAKVLEPHCDCPCCLRGKGYSRSKLHMMLKSGEPLAAQLMTAHNIAYMMRLVRRMRVAILDGIYEDFVREFIKKFYPDGYSEEVMEEKGGEEVGGKEGGEKDAQGEKERGGNKKDGPLYVPKWVVEALGAADIDLTKKKRVKD